MKVEIKNSPRKKQKVFQNLVHFTGDVFSLEITDTRALATFFPVPVYLVNHNLQKCLFLIFKSNCHRVFEDFYCNSMIQAAISPQSNTFVT